MEYATLFVGIDISKLKHDIAIVNEQKQLMHKLFVIKDNRQGYQYLINKLNLLAQKLQTKTFKIGMEATGDYWKNIYYFLKEQSPAFDLTVINPVQTKAFTKTELRRAKTDPINAKDIALFMAEKKPQPTGDKLPLFDHIKDIDTQIHAVKKQLSMTTARLRIEMQKVAPEIEHEFKSLATLQILALLENYPTAQLIAKTTVEQLRNVRYGSKQWALPMSFIEKIKMMAENSIAHKKGAGAEFVVQSLIRQIKNYYYEIRLLNEQIVQLYQQLKTEDSLLTSISGISKQTAIVMEAYIGDVNRFPSAKQIVAYFGMNPTINRSGKSIKRKSYLEKKGSGIVRHKLYMAILCIIRHKTSPIYDYYNRLVKAGKPKLVAIGAAMRKLLVIIYTMLKKNEKFNPNKM
jgi:transposase